MVFRLQIVIAFTYRRDKVLVGCKYREVSKKFSQVCSAVPFQVAFLIYISMNIIHTHFFFLTGGEHRENFVWSG